jgi:hypothetical protein
MVDKKTDRANEGSITQESKIDIGRKKQSRRAL